MGELDKFVFPRRGEVTRGGQRQPRVRDKRHLMVVAGLPSVISGCMPCQVCHIRYSDHRYGKTNPGMQQKPSDKYVLPLTPYEHEQQHKMNERRFWEAMEIDPIKLALTLYSVWDEQTMSTEGAGEIMRRIIERTRQ